jgi:hypothetical protein
VFFTLLSHSEPEIAGDRRGRLRPPPFSLASAKRMIIAMPARRNQLDCPIRIWSARRRAMMPGDKVDRSGLEAAAALAAKALEDVFKRSVALALYQQAHRVTDRPAAAMQLNHAMRPIGQLVREAEAGRVHASLWTGTKREQERSSLAHSPHPCPKIWMATTTIATIPKITPRPQLSPDCGLTPPRTEKTQATARRSRPG